MSHRRRHRLHHRRQKSDRETTWFQAYDGLSIYFYNEATIDISTRQRPDELLDQTDLALEWDATLDPSTSHFFFTSRLWPNLIIWHVPKDVDKKRHAHLERKKLRAFASKSVMDDIVLALENVDSSNVHFWPHNAAEEHRQLNMSYRQFLWTDPAGQETTETGATKDIDAAVATEIVAASKDNNEDDIEDNIEDNINDDNNDDNEDNNNDDNEDNNKDNSKNNSEQNRFNNETKGTPNTLELQETVHKDHTCIQNDATLFDWVVSSDNDNEEYQLYEHKEFKVLVDIIEAIVCTIEIFEKTSNDEQKRREEKQKEEKETHDQEQRQQEEKQAPKKKEKKQNTKTKKEEENTTAQESNDGPNNDGHALRLQQAKAEKNKDNALLAALWVSMTNNTCSYTNNDNTVLMKHTRQNGLITSVAQAIAFTSIGRIKGMPAGIELMSMYQYQLGNMWRERDTTHRTAKVQLFLDDVIDTIVHQHELWDSEKTQHQNDQYFKSLENFYLKRPSTALKSSMSEKSDAAITNAPIYSDDDDDDEDLLLDSNGAVSQSQHYSKFQFLSNCYYFGLRAATLISSLLKQKTARLVKWNQHKTLSNVPFLTCLGQAFSENKSCLGLKMEGDPFIEDKQLNAEGIRVLFQESLQENSTFVMLHLANNNIGIDGGNIMFQSMRVNSRLHELDLSNNNMNEKVAPLIATCLRENNVLATLNLSGNQLSDTGADLITDALWDNKGLRHLNLSSNQIGDAGLFLLSRNIRRSEHLKKIDLRNNLFMYARAKDVRKYWSDENNQQHHLMKKKHPLFENKKVETLNVPETNEDTMADLEMAAAMDDKNDTTAKTSNWPHNHLINHEMRSTVVVQTVRGDDRAKPALIVQSVLGCVIGAVERYSDADVPGHNIPAAQMTLSHFYDIALEEGDDHLFTPGDPDKILQTKRAEIIRSVVSGLVNTIEIYWESAGNPVNKLEISLALKDVVEAVVQANLIKTPEMIAIEEKALNRKRKLDQQRQKEQELKEQKRIEEEEESSSDESSSDDENKAHDEAALEEKKMDPKELQELQCVVDDLIHAALDADTIIDWKDDSEKQEHSRVAIATQWQFLHAGNGPYHQGHRNLIRQRLMEEDRATLKRAYDDSNAHRNHIRHLQSKYEVLGGCDHVAVVVDALMNAVAWCDLSSVEDGLALLDSEKGPFNMNARKIRKKKREEFEIQRNELLQLNYPPHYDKSYQNHLETDDNERIVLKMCYGVNAHMNDLHKLDLKRQEKCRPIVEGMLTAVLDWQHVLEEREVEEERVASETPRTVEKRMKEQKKADKLRLKAIKKEHKGISMEDAEDLLYQEQNPPQKTEQVEVKERYEANCKLTFSSAMLSSDEIEAKRLAAEAALEIPTVRLRIECAKALKNADFIGLSDPFVVVYDSIKLNPNDEALEDVVPKDEAIKGSKPKDNTPNAPNVPIGTTQVVDDSLEPVWDEGFDVHIGNIDDFMLRKFRFEVYDYDIIGDNEFLGACQLTGEEVLERCGKPNKYWNLSGMKGKSMTYVGGRIKLGFDLLGDGGFSSGNDVYSETLDIPALGDTPLDFLAYGLYRSGLEMIKLETEHWIPVRHILGKLPNTTNAESTREDKDNIRDALKTCTLKGLGMSPIEQSLVVKCLAFNTLVEHLDWGSNKIEPTVLMSLCWLFQESNSLEHINLYPCSLDINSQMCRLACAEITKGLVSSLRPQTIRLSPNGGYLRVQHLIGRYLSIDESAATEEHALVTEEPSCLNLRSRILEMNEPIHLLDDILVANLIWLSTAQINAKEEERLMLAAQKEVDESDKEEKEKGKKKQEALEEELNFFDTHDAQENNDEENENGPHKLTYSSVESANGIYIRPGQQLLDYAKRLLHQCEVAYICTQLRPMDTCRIIYLSFEACGLDSNSKYPISSSSLLMSALTSNRSVTDLNLSDNQIGAHHDCGESLKTLLSSNNRLLNVNMSRNPLGYISKPYPSSTSGAICAMAEGLSMNTNLRALALSDCGVQVKGAEALGISLTKNTSLLSLDLSRNHGVTRYGAVCLANGLERNSGLETLNCAGCSMGMAGATAVAKMLQTNTTLIHLNMSGNPTDKRGSAIQCFGALAIALALRENCTLQSLSLAASGIESAGATYIAHALVVNTTLLTLDLEGVRPHEIRARQPMKPPIRKDDQNVDPLYFEELDLNAIVSKKEEVALRLAMARQIKLKEELQHIAGAPGFDGRIHREGALAIAQALKKNKTLTELSVAQNYIMNEGTEALLGAVLEHPKMMALDLSGSNMNEQIVDKLIQKLHRRSRQENPEASTSAMSAPSASSASTTKTTTTTSNETSNFRYLLLTGAELGREAVAKLQDACETQKITLHCFEDSPLLELEELDADDDPMKEIREVQRKVQEKTAQEAIRSRFVVYSEDFPYESKGIAMKDNFNRCPETWQAKLRAAAELDNPAPLQKLIDELEDLTPEPEATAAAKGPDKKYKRGRHQ